jgi:hypothetical protein
MNDKTADNFAGGIPTSSEGYALNWFILSAGAILATTGIAKVWSALGSSKYLAVIDPIFGVQFGQLFLVVGTAEIVIALVCFFSKRQIKKRMKPSGKALDGWAKVLFGAPRLGTGPVPGDSRNSHAILWLTLVALFPAGLGHCAGDGAYSGAGNITYRVFSPAGDGSIMVEKKFSFQFICKGKLWKIQAQDIGESDFERYNAFNDGTNTYVLTTVKKVVFLKAISELSEIDKSANTNLIAEIYPISFPPPSMSPLNQIWLAYCSGQLLKESKDGVFRPLWQYSRRSFYVLDRFVKTSHDSLANGFGLPKQLIQYSDGAEYGVLDNGRIQVGNNGQFPKPYSSGFERLRYRVLETTNVANKVIAHTFQLVMLMPKKDGKTAEELVRTCEYEGHLATFLLGNHESEIVANLERGASVCDYRSLHFDRSVENVTYRSPGRDWLPMLSGSLPYELFQQHKAARGPAVIGPIAFKSRPLITIAALLATTLAAALLGIFWFRRNA